MSVLAELFAESTRSTLADVMLVIGVISAIGAWGARWLRREIRSEVTKQTAELDRTIREVRDDVRAELRPNGGKSAADHFTQRTAHETARLVAEILDRRDNAE